MSETVLLVYYAGRTDRELDAAVVRAVGSEAIWAGEGRDRDGAGRELGWEFRERGEAEHAASRVSSGVSRSGLSVRLRAKGVVE